MAQVIGEILDWDFPRTTLRTIFCPLSFSHQHLSHLYTLHISCKLFLLTLTLPCCLVTEPQSYWGDWSAQIWMDIKIHSQLKLILSTIRVWTWTHEHTVPKIISVIYQDTWSKNLVASRLYLELGACLYLETYFQINTELAKKTQYQWFAMTISVSWLVP